MIYNEVLKFYKNYKGRKCIIGYSFEGRPIPAMHVGSLFGRQYIAVYAIHGREWITARLALRHIKKPTQEGGWIIPLANPDGAIFSQTLLPMWKANARGVDLNVNFDADWGTGRLNTRTRGAENCTGDFPFSEPESKALADFTVAKSQTDARIVEEAILMPGRKVTLACSKRKVMGIDVPSIQIEDNKGDMYPYSFLSVTAQLDDSLRGLNAVLYKLIQLAETEKACNMLADEIEKNKRRVNALENIMIPQLTETIKYIKMKLDESERSATVRLMKVKDMING